ncbi:MAG: DegT/DnrJ/EryC1/StrS family aminotransferase [Pirellulaceae bacterium]
MKFRIPLFDLNYGDEEIAAVAETIHDNWISMGPRCEAFESEFAAMLGASCALTVDNCTNALFLALRTLGIGPGDEVLVPSLTFVATVNAVRYAGAEPVFCDITSADNLCVSPAELARQVTPRARAMIVMHYGGFPCDMDAVLALAQERGLFVIEDACHGPLSEWQGRRLGTIGDIGCFSFFSNKNISTGEGGMMVFRDKTRYDRAKLLKSHGMTTTSYQRAGGHSTQYDVVELGYNFRMDDIRAALGRVQLRKLPLDLAQRAEVRCWYEEQLAGIPDIVVPFAGHKGFVSNYIVPVALRTGGVERRDAIRDSLHAAGIQTSVHYPAVHRFSIYRSKNVILPLTEFASDHLITLPMYSKLTESDVASIASVLKRAVERS